MIFKDFNDYAEAQSKIIEDIYLLTNRYKSNEVEYKEQLKKTDSNKELVLSNKPGIKLDALKTLLNKYNNLVFSEEELSIITGVINKRNLTIKEVDKKLSDISNYKDAKGIKDLKLFTIKSINKYAEEKQQRELIKTL